MKYRTDIPDLGSSGGRLKDATELRRRRSPRAISVGAAGVLLALAMTVQSAVAGYVPALAGSDPLSITCSFGVHVERLSGGGQKAWCKPAPTKSVTTTVPATTVAPATTVPVTTLPPVTHGVAVDESAIPAPATGFSSSRIGPAMYTPSTGDGVGAFRINCSLSHMNFDDPLVFPGQVRATHLHAFYGNTGVNANSTNTSINGSGNSTCTGGTENRSAYWAPSMIDTATGRPVNQSAGTTLDRDNALQVYYKTGYQGVATNTVRNFPAGLRMIAGDSRSTGPQQRMGTGQPLPVVYYCVLGTTGVTSPEQASFPACAAGQILVMKIIFPQCWDGINLDSANHKSHMAYGTWGPTSGQNGAGCPSTHPVPLPEITQNYRFRVPAGGMSTWRLTSDTYSGPAGYSGHADWWNGWNAPTFQRVVTNCYTSGLDCHMNLLGDGQALY